MREHATYPPLGTLKPVAEDVWIVDGPVIRFGFPWPKLPFPTRMCVIGLRGGLFLHSPTPLAPALAEAIAALGAPRWIVGANRIHYWWVPEWKAADREAEVWLAPRVAEQAGDRIAFDWLPLEGAGGYPWADAVETLAVPGSFMSEFVFFHRPSRTLVLTDLIENFEAEKLGSAWLRWLMRAGGVLAPMAARRAIWRSPSPGGTGGNRARRSRP